MHSAGATQHRRPADTTLSSLPGRCVCATLKQLCNCATLIAACDALWRTLAHGGSRQVHTQGAHRSDSGARAFRWLDQHETEGSSSFSSSGISGASYGRHSRPKTEESSSFSSSGISGASYGRHSRPKTEGSSSLRARLPHGTPGAILRALERLDPSRLGPCTAVATSSVPSSRSRRFGRH